ncbi:hypothetical protein C3L33_14939, partial [Rhododendron williamsianum]
MPTYFDYFKKFKKFKLFEPSVGILGFFLVTVCIICCFFYLDYRAVAKGFRISGNSDRFFRLKFGENGHEDKKVEFLAEKGGGCDVFDGDWVWDETYPLYQSRDCRFMDDGFRCSENGRPDLFYTKWRWQPKDCNLPRGCYFQEGAEVKMEMEVDTAYIKSLGKVAVVTGSDSRIGRAACYAFALEGATVAFTYVADREEKDAEDTLRMIKDVKASNAKDPMAMAADLGYDENCKMVVDEVIDEFGRIDILVNSAAEQHLTNTVEEITEERLDRVFRTNIFSQFFMTSGPRPRLDPAPTGLDAEDKVAKLGSETPMNRAAQPHGIAPAYVFLACNHCSSYFTGQVLHPNGGMIVNA